MSLMAELFDEDRDIRPSLSALSLDARAHLEVRLRLLRALHDLDV